MRTYQLICQHCTTEGFTLLFFSSNFIFVPESHIRHNLTHLIPASCVHAFCRANTSSTCLLSQSVWLSCPLCRDVLCASLSIHLSFSAVRLVNITVSFFFLCGFTRADSSPFKPTIMPVSLRR